MTEKLEEGWKVIKWGSRQSVIILAHTAGLHYPKNRRVYPKPNCGPIAVFKSKRSAKFFENIHGGKTVRCRYKPSGEVLMWYGIETIHLQSCPTGTALADFVICLE